MTAVPPAQTVPLVISGMRMWTPQQQQQYCGPVAAKTAIGGMSERPVVIVCADKPCASTKAPNAVIASITEEDALAKEGDVGSSAAVHIRPPPAHGEQQSGGSAPQFYVLPGLIDSHVHFLDGGRRKAALNLSDCHSRRDVVAAIRRFVRRTLLWSYETDGEGGEDSGAKGDQSLPFSTAEILRLNAWKEKCEEENGGSTAAAAAPSVPWVFGFQWNDVQLGALPNKHWLDEACRGDSCADGTSSFADIPIILTRLDCHSCVVNSCALRLAGIDAFGPPNPEGGQIDRWSSTAAQSGAASPQHVVTTTQQEATTANVNNDKGICTTNASAPAERASATSSPFLGEPTGYIREKAMQIIHKVRRQTWHVTDGDLGAAYDAAAAELLANGITACFSMTSLDYDNVKEFEYLMRRSTAATGGEGGGDGILLRMRSVVTVEEIGQLEAFKGKHFGDATTTPASAASSPLHDFGTDYLRFGAVKIFSDGSLGSRTAAMLEAYGDVENHNNADPTATTADGEGEEEGGCGLTQSCPCGTLLSPVEDLRSSIALVARKGLQCCTHAIGDRACQVIQDAYEACTVDDADANNNKSAPSGEKTTYAGQSLRFRIEHCQHVASMAELDRYKRTGTIPSVQPCHLLFDGDHITSGRLGPKRVELAYVFRSMLQRGVRPVFGTDWMVAPICPISNIMAAVHRTPIQFTDNDNTTAAAQEDDDDVTAASNASSKAANLISTVPVWNAKEKLTVEESLTAYTSDAARAMFMEDAIGRIAVGYYADMIIVDANPFAVLSDDEAAGGARGPRKGCTTQGAQLPVNPIRVVVTVVGGRVRYVAKGYEHLLVRKQ